MTQSDVRVDGPPTAPASARGFNQRGLRAYNERLVLSLLRRYGPLAKAPVARTTGLSAQTVSVIMRRLEDEGLLLRCDPQRGKVGQPSIPMVLNPEGAFFMGLKIGRRSLDLVLIDFTGKVLRRMRRTHPFPEPGATVRFAVSGVTEMLAELPPELRVRVTGIGIATPYFLWDWARSIGVGEEEMASWRTRNIAAEIEERLALPTFLQNDATSACGAELVFGDRKPWREFVYFYIGYFVGGGLVLDGRLHVGRTGNAGALGSMPIPSDQGGSRQLIDYASLACLERRLLAAGGDGESLWGEPSGWAVPQDLIEDWIADAACGIAHATVATASVTDIGAAIIDGWLPDDVRAALVEAVRAKLDATETPGLYKPVVEAGSIGRDARALGAASLPLSENFLVDPNAIMSP